MSNSPIKTLCERCQSLFLKQQNKREYCERCNSGCYRQVGKIWRPVPEFQPEGFPLDRCNHLLALEKEHFWFEPRYQLLSRRLKKFLPVGLDAAIDLGAGVGSFVKVLQRQFSTVVGVDGHITFLDKAQKCNPDTLFIHSDVSDIPLISEQFDLVVALDVLEHTNPIPLLKEANRIAKQNGYMLITVPAFQFLWSSVDSAAGHRCRYNIKNLQQELNASGWHLINYTYYQFFLFPVLLFSRFLNRKSKPQMEHKPPAWINYLFKKINLLEVKLLGGVKLPFGSSLVVLAQKK